MMGFMDRLKGAAQQAAGTATQAANPGGMASQRDKIMRINKVGVETRATVDSMQETGTQLGGGHKMEFDLTVHPDGGEDYAAHVSQALHDATLQGIAEGGIVTVKVDPEDPSSMLVWGAAS
jgi:hypothetical protein